MFKTLLFDLDGTLLDLDMDRFLPKYFRALTSRFLHLMEPEEFVHHLMASTQAMINNTDPEVTNEEAFMAQFLPRIKMSWEKLHPLLEDFYRNDFGKLGDDVCPNPLAPQIIQEAFDKGLEVVIATNPVFPRLAVFHRLGWAKVDTFPYRLVTTYECMHSCKPHPQYFQEILSQIGRDAGECLMIGNDVQEDLPARQVGLATYLVKDYIINRNGEEPRTDYQGYLKDLYRFVKEL